jgi:hypothetical protein
MARSRADLQRKTRRTCPRVTVAIQPTIDAAPREMWRVPLAALHRVLFCFLPRNRHPSSRILQQPRRRTNELIRSPPTNGTSRKQRHHDSSRRSSDDGNAATMGSDRLPRRISPSRPITTLNNGPGSHFNTLERDASLVPDDAIIQTWDRHPSHFLRETQPETLAYLLGGYGSRH